jgi:hypothetical protein
MVKTVATDDNSNVYNCGNDVFLQVDCARKTETVVMHKGIFENAFGDEWTAPKPDPLEHTAIIDHIINLCDFLADSVMVKFIDQQQWSTLEHVVSVGFYDVGEFFTVRDDGITFNNTLMLIPLQRFKAFLLYYRNKTCWGEGPTVDDVMRWTSTK